MLTLDDATPEQLDEAAGENLVAHMTWVQGRTAGMAVEADDELTVVDSGLACDTFNFVCRARIAPANLRDRIARVVERFTSVARPFSWWVGPADRPEELGAALLDAGFEAAESEVAMTADLDALATVDLAPGGLRIERATTERHLRDFAALNAANWSPPDEDVLRFYERAVPVLLAPDSALWIYVGYVEDEPVATAELTVGGGVVGLYNISTLEAHRRRGYGSALTLRPLLDAREAGFRVGVLQASADGVGVYRRVGFRATGSFTEYQLPRG